VEDAGQEAERAFGREAAVEPLRAGGGEDAGGEQGFDLRMERDRAGVGEFRERRGDDLLVFFRLQRAGGVNDAAAGTDGAQGGAEDGALSLGLAREVRGAQTVANLGIAAQGAGAAARDVGQDNVKSGAFFEGRGVGEAALDLGSVSSKALAQPGEALRAGFAGDDADLGVAFGKDEGLAAGSGATVENRVRGASLPCDFGDQLRAFILKADAALAKGRGCGDIAGEDGAGGGEQLAGDEFDAGLA